jgi:hypothetical protein
MNISFANLGSFFGIDKEKAERLIAEAVNEGSVKATLDQQNEMVEFTDESDPVEHQLIFNKQIEALCKDVNSLANEIENAHPHLTK